MYPTKVISSKTNVHPLSAKYNTPDNPSPRTRENMASVTATNKSVWKYAAQVHRLTQLPEPPLRLALGDDAVAAMRGKAGRLVKDLDDFAVWSSDLDE